VKFPINMSINLLVSDNIHLNLNKVQTNVGQFSFYLENHWFQFLEEIKRTNLIFEQFYFYKFCTCFSFQRVPIVSLLKEPLVFKED
jgi:hypothetical protein